MATGHKREAVAHVLALADRPFTRWHELTLAEQGKYRTKAKRLLDLGAEYDPEIREFMEPKGPAVS